MVTGFPTRRRKGEYLVEKGSVSQMRRRIGKRAMDQTAAGVGFLRLLASNTDLSIKLER